MPKKKPTLTPKRRALVRNLIAGQTITEAEKNAGFSTKNPGQSGYQALKEIAKSEFGAALLAKHGLTDDTLIENYLKPALEATEQEVSSFEGEFFYSKHMPAWNPRIKALDAAFRLRGLYVREESAQNGGININFILDAPRPMNDANRNRTAIDTAE